MAVILRTSLQGCGLEGISGCRLKDTIGCGIDDVNHWPRF